MRNIIVFSSIVGILGAGIMPTAFSKRSVSPDLDVLVESVDEMAPRPPPNGNGRRQRTLAGSQTTLTKGQKSVQTIANNAIGGDNAVTIIFGIPGTAPFLGPDNHSPTPRAYAKITWLVDGVGIDRLISIVSGEQITGVGEYVSVQVWDDTVPHTNDPNPEYQITCIMAPGTRGSADTLPSYYPNLNPANNDGPTFGLAASASINIPIPQDVGMKNYTIYSSDPTDTQIEYIDYAGNVLFQFQLTDVELGVPIEIPPGALTITVTNTNGSMTALGGYIVFGVSG